MDERFHEGIQEFNRGYFFEAHDILEDLWHEYRESDRLFLQGLIQVAVGYYHFENRNLKGARSQFSKACSKLEPYQPVHQGILIGELIFSVKQCLDAVVRAEKGEVVEFEKIEIPKIKYTNHSSDHSQQRST